MSRILVTGATGFIGRHTLAPLLAAGFDVHAVARHPPSPEDAEPAVQWHAADLLDPGQRRAVTDRVRASHLLHLAWESTPGVLWTSPQNASWVAATIGLTEDFAAAGGERAVLAGTCAEYDWTAPQPLREDAPLDPGTLYGVCKDATRRVVSGLGSRCGVAVAWGRVFFLYGPGEDERRLVAGVARKLISGERAATSAGEQVRDFLHVDDVAAGFAALAAGSVTGAVNIASGQGVTVRRIVELVAASTGRPELVDAGALAARPGDPPSLVADVTRLRDEVGLEPAISLEDGITATVAWWRERVAPTRVP